MFHPGAGQLLLEVVQSLWPAHICRTAEQWPNLIGFGFFKAQQNLLFQTLGREKLVLIYSVRIPEARLPHPFLL